MPSVVTRRIMPSVDIPSVVMLSVVAPYIPLQHVVAIVRH